MDGTEMILVLSRLAHFAATMLLFGLSAFRIHFRAAFHASRGLDLDFNRWLRPILVVGSAVALVSSIAWLDAEAAAMGNGLPDALSLQTISTVLFQTEFGHVWVWRLAAGIFLLCILSSLPGRRWNMRAVALVSGIAAFLVASLGGTGHAVTNGGLLGWTDMAIQTLHILAAAAWLGSLIALGYVLFRARTDRRGAWRGLAEGILPRYSRAGYVMVGVIAVTGSLRSWTLVSRAAQLVDTIYGRVLLAKIYLFALMVALAMVNRLAVSPVAISSSAMAPGRTSSLFALERNVVLEQLLGIVVVGAVSVLGTLYPASMG
jgi:putative copper resistance protein D